MKNTYSKNALKPLGTPEFEDDFFPDDAHSPAGHDAFAENNEAYMLHQRKAHKNLLHADPERVFVKQDDGHYYWSFKLDKPAILDNEKEIVVRTNHKTAARMAVRVASKKGWQGIEIDSSANAEFKRHAWLEAKALGMEVKGYTPDEKDMKALAELVKENEQKLQHMMQDKDILAKQATFNPDKVIANDADFNVLKRLDVSNKPAPSDILAAVKQQQKQPTVSSQPKFEAKFGGYKQ